jgi:hypothetical protein
MAKKNYKKRIEEDLEAMRQDPEVALGYSSDDMEVDEDCIMAYGDMFDLVSSTMIEHITNGTDDTVAKAFRESGLDPKSPFHWYYLLKVFTDVHYTNKLAGAKKRRTHDYLIRFRRHYADKARKKPDASDNDLCEMMKADHPDLYGNKPISTLRRILAESRAEYLPPDPRYLA